MYVHLELIFCTVSSRGECRSADIFPWKELGTTHGREQVLVDAADFSAFGSIWPTSGMPYGTVRELARRLVVRQDSDLPLFMHSSPTDTTPTIISPLPDFSEHSATSIVQETPNLGPATREPRDAHSPEIATQLLLLPPPPPPLALPPPLAAFLSDQPVFTTVLPIGIPIQNHPIPQRPPSPAAQSFSETSHEMTHENSVMVNDGVAEAEQHQASGSAVAVKTKATKKRKKTTPTAPELSPKRLCSSAPKITAQKSKSGTAAMYVITSILFPFTHSVLLVSHPLVAAQINPATSDSCSRKNHNLHSGPTLLTLLTLSSSTIRDPGLSYSPSSTESYLDYILVIYMAFNQRSGEPLF